jgi:capsular polysaccharide biosynthesis protein
VITTIFCDLAFVELADPYVRADDVYWLDRGFIQNMPAAWLLGLRERVMKRRPAPARDRNVYIARRGTRQVENATEVERFLLRRNFTFHTLDDLSIDDQIDLFSAADWVVAAHGAELGNLLFCQPGTKVLELSPELDFKPYFSYMCNKLSLHHGVLPCPTTDGGFNGRLVVDMNKFRALFRMLHHRL